MFFYNENDDSVAQLAHKIMTLMGNGYLKNEIWLGFNLFSPSDRICLGNSLAQFNSLRPSDAYMRQQDKPSLVPSHYLNQCWFIVKWTLGNKFQWNKNKNCSLFIKKHAFENVVCEMVAILPQLQCLKYLSFTYTNALIHTVKSHTVI